MGRYDKIKVYNGTDFVNPSRIRVYDGKVWQDLGPANSDFKKSMYVRHEGINKRVTLNKQINTVTGDKYRNGAFTAQPYNGYCFCPISSNAGSYSFHVEMYIKRGSTGAKNIFKSWGKWVFENNIFIRLNADNTINIATSCTYDSKGNKIDYARGDNKNTTLKIKDGQWNHIKIIANKDEKIIKVTLNGVEESLSGLNYTWLVYSDNAVGDNGLYIRSDGLYISSVDGNGDAHTHTDAYANVNETYTEESWI